MLEEHGKRPKLIVSTDNGGVIGWRACSRGTSAASMVVEDLLYADPVHQGGVIGRALLAEFIKEARGLGCRTTVATISSDNRAGLQLHSKLSIDVVGTMRDAAHKFDCWMDVNLVQLTLEGKG